MLEQTYLEYFDKNIGNILVTNLTGNIPPFWSCYMGSAL